MPCDVECSVLWVGTQLSGAGTNKVPSWIKSFRVWGTWVEHLNSAQIMISWFMGSGPASGSLLAAQSLEPLLILCLPVSPSPACVRALSRSLSLSQK